jgi:hypothetical protein
MTLAPPGVARRWTVVGHTLEGWECTTLFDLPRLGEDNVVIHPAAVSKYTVAITFASTQRLLNTIETGNECSVPVRHAIHSGQSLCLRPISLPQENLGPMELFLRLPDVQFSVVFKRDRLRHLATILADILRYPA